MDSQDAAGSSGGRSRRQKVDKAGRLAALDKLRGLKGNKNKYEVSDVNAVWDDVDEREYSKMVRDRQDDDWIIDDDGQGYVEDGREIFDDEYINNEDITIKSKHQKQKSKNKQGAKSCIGTVAGQTKNKDLKSMFSSMPIKKKADKDIKLDDDNLLGDILQDLQKDTTSTPIIKPTVLKKKASAKQMLVLPSVSSNRSTSSALVSNSQTPTRTPLVKKLRPRLMTYDSETSINSGEDKVSQQSEEKNALMTDSEMISEDFSDPFGMDNVEDEALINCIDDSTQNVNTEQESNQVESKVAIKKEFEEDMEIPENMFTDNWDEICGKSSPIEVDSESRTQKQRSVHLDASKLPLETNENGEIVLRMYWLDAYEDYFKHPGVVYLFGKVWVESVKVFVSCCVVVRNIERKVFVLPREYRRDLKTNKNIEQAVCFKDVHEEFNNLLTNKFKIMKFRCRKVTKKYCFEKLDVPKEAEYLEARYSAQDKPLPADLYGETFSHIFGTNTSSLEQLLIDQRIKGPCWLEIKDPLPSSPSLSWCKVEVVTDKSANVMVIQKNSIPPLVLMAFGMKTIINPKTHENEIVTVSCLTHHNFHLDKPAPVPPFQEHFCGVTRPSDCIFPFDLKDQLVKQNRYKVERTESERALLGYLIARIQTIDPDIIMGHDITFFDMDVLLHRLQVNKIPNWSRIGRLRRSVMPKSSVGGRISGVTCGRLLCDIKIMAKELLRSKSYDLTELTKLVLKKERIEINVSLSFNSSQQLLKLIEWSLLDVSYSLQIIYEINALPLALQITNIAGNIMSRTLLGGRSERNEFLLLHAFAEKDYIVPDKRFGKASIVPAATNIDIDHEDGDAVEANNSKKTQSRRKKAAYSGGLVLEPKRGFYDKYILLMDFNSLYPSIIQEYNICFTTISRVKPNDSADENDDLEIVTPDGNLPAGILPTEIRKLVESRRQVKQLLKTPNLSPDLAIQYDIRQKALKLTANSMYGCLGFANSRFYAKPLAAFITSKGRDILLQTKDLVQKINLDVVYGDTDSLMINSNSTELDQVLKIGNKLKAEINKLYKHLEIEIDGVFKCLLLLKKKKYAALTIQQLPNGELITSEEIKGVDIVRRDWSDLACDAGRFVIHEILSSKARDEILDNIQSYLCTLKAEIMEDKIHLNKMTITKQLTKNPEDYPDKASLPHVNVAIRLNSKGGKKIKQGDTVSYIICEDGSNLPATQRAYHLSEMKTNEVKIDKQYYLGQQIHPVVSRLCDPIDGMDAAGIAECLGLDPTRFHTRSTNNARDNEDDAMLGGSGLFSTKAMYEKCERFKFSCPEVGCGQELIMDGPFRGEGMERQCVLKCCPNPTCHARFSYHIGTLCNQLTRDIRRLIHKYYQGWLCCDDPVCQDRTQKLPIRFIRGHPICNSCGKGNLHREYTDRDLWVQLCFYQHIFDPEKAAKSLKPEEKEVVRADIRQLQQEYGQLRAVVTRVLNSSAYSQVDLMEVFEGIFTTTKPPSTQPR